MKTWNNLAEAQSVAQKSTFVPEPSAEEQQRAIDAASGKTLGNTPEAKRFFELRGLYNRGKVGLSMVWTALRNAEHAQKRK